MTARLKSKLSYHESVHGPHFNEDYAMMVVGQMQNEDGSRGEHFSIDQACALAQQYGINLYTEKYNKYDFYVALNMLYSDFYKPISTLVTGDKVRFYVEMAKAWLNDKDVEEGKMWNYYKYVILPDFREGYEDDAIEFEGNYARSGRRGMGRMSYREHEDYDYDDMEPMKSSYSRYEAPRYKRTSRYY